MNYASPEAVGVRSEDIERYVKGLEEKNLATHDIIMARGDNIFFEKYYEPFDREFFHRMYSVSKSIVSIAVGFMLGDNLADIDDPMEKFFGDELKNQTDENIKKQTIRDMLMMCTAKPNRVWFDHRPEDRVRFYFENNRIETRPAGTVYYYDSEGSFILGALVENLTGKTLTEYLNEKLFKKIGVSEKTSCLKCPGGHSWGDSGMLLRPVDLLKIARFILNGGSWNGEQLLDREYIKNAVSFKTYNNQTDACAADTLGYGWQIWRTYGNSFFFNGMGCQYAVCVPDKDMILIYNADNQGKENVTNSIIEDFIKGIAQNASDEPLAKNPEAEKSLREATSGLKLAVTRGNVASRFEKEFTGRVYTLGANPMGIERFKVEIENGEGKFIYKNAQGEKTVRFGMGKNVISEFPQDGYSSEIGGVTAKGNHYRCAASGAWVEEKKLHIYVQIIDRYFGNLGITIGFKDDVCGMRMIKHAEDFLSEYQGFAGGHRE